MAHAAELIWNLKRLIRDGFPKGLPLHEFETLYKHNFRSEIGPTPNRILPGCKTWAQVFKKSDKFRKWFRLDKNQRIQVLPIPERDLRVYFTAVCYTQYIAARNGAKIDEWSGISESEDDLSDSDNPVGADGELNGNVDLPRIRRKQPAGRAGNSRALTAPKAKVKRKRVTKKVRKETSDSDTNDGYSNLQAEYSDWSFTLSDCSDSGDKEISGNSLNADGRGQSNLSAELISTGSTTFEPSNEMLSSPGGNTAVSSLVPHPSAAIPDILNGQCGSGAKVDKADRIRKQLHKVCQPTVCKLCSQLLQSASERKRHYEGSSHLAELKKWLGMKRIRCVKPADLSWRTLRPQEKWEQQCMTILMTAKEVLETAPLNWGEPRAPIFYVYFQNVTKQLRQGYFATPMEFSNVLGRTFTNRLFRFLENEAQASENVEKLKNLIHVDVHVVVSEYLTSTEAK